MRIENPEISRNELEIGLDAISEPAAALETLLRLSEEQVESKGLLIENLDTDDFALGCDALNFWRIAMRWDSELCEEVYDRFRTELMEYVCERRGYDIDDFELALEATRGRVRIPFGKHPIDWAYQRNNELPVELLSENLANRPRLATIAGIAVYVNKTRHKSYILLPVEKIRQTLACRKVAITGAIKVLLDNGFIEAANTKYGQGKARRFFLRAEEGVHFRFAQRLPNQPR